MDLTLIAFILSGILILGAVVLYIVTREKKSDDGGDDKDGYDYCRNKLSVDDQNRVKSQIAYAKQLCFTLPSELSDKIIKFATKKLTATEEETVGNAVDNFFFNKNGFKILMTFLENPTKQLGNADEAEFIQFINDLGEAAYDDETDTSKLPFANALNDIKVWIITCKGGIDKLATPDAFTIVQRVNESDFSDASEDAVKAALKTDILKLKSKTTSASQKATTIYNLLMTFADHVVESRNKKDWACCTERRTDVNGAILGWDGCH